jgi:hypothetical protein
MCNTRVTKIEDVSLWCELRALIYAPIDNMEETNQVIN